ncbi:MAG: SagB/ThcOx family dehydrogenase [Rhizobiaceae bacterium]
MRNRTSSALAFGLSEDGIVGFNFLQKSAFTGSGALLEHLASNSNWSDSPATSGDEALSYLELGALVREASSQDLLEQEFADKWVWGLPAALFHFSVQGNEYASLKQSENKQRASAERLGLPELHLSNKNHTQIVALDNVLNRSDQMQLMARRRSIREAKDGVVTLSSLSSILFSGMGITGKTHNAVTELPLSMTPSGGGRNPYEAYVFVRKVESLKPGIYHYSACEHTLGRLGGQLPEKLSEVIADQDWGDDMSFIIVLAAFFERTMWKYDDPNAYRVVLIEAGHIGQNMLLMATEEGLCGCPTAALSHDLLFDTLELPSRITCAPIYAIAVGTGA